MRDGEQSLERALAARRELSADFELQIAAGEQLLTKLTRIAGAAQPPAAEPTSRCPTRNSVAAAAQAFAERARARLEGLAA